MADVFISYAHEEQAVADYLKRHLDAEGLAVFCAPVSIDPGRPWSDDILAALRGSRWVLFLASPAACASAYVQQELGGALVANKSIIPILWGIRASDLPGWMSRYQAVDPTNKTAEEVARVFEELAAFIRAKKVKGDLIGAVILGAALVFLARID